MQTQTLEATKATPKTNGAVSKSYDVLKLITPQLDAFLLTVTPAMAEVLLTLNTWNRAVAQARVDAYTDYQKNGRWIFCGNEVRFSSDLVMQDGQKSLMAVIASGTTQMFVIVTGLEPRAFSVMDTGDMRSAGDVLFIKGFKHAPKQLAAAIKASYYWEKYGKLAINIHKNRVSNTQVDEWSENKGNMKLMVACLDYAKELQDERRATFLAASTWAFVYYTLSKIHRAEATDFITLLSRGENLSMTKNAPIYLLREKLINFDSSGHTKIFIKGGSLVTDLKLRYVFRAWNAWRTKEEMTKLSIDTKEPKIEKPI